MAADSDQNLEPDWLHDLPLRSKDIGFSPDELVECTGCGKSNAPNRVSCLYCGKGIGAQGIERLEIRELESWENGFNVILVNAAHADLDLAAKSLAILLGTDRDALRSLLQTGKHLPLCRVESKGKATAISEKLDALSVETLIVDDVSLRPNTTPFRLRSITFAPGDIQLELFNGGDITTLRPDELVLIVTGVFLEGRTESVERRKRGTAKTLSETETTADHPVIDIYSSTDPNGWRIPGSGFDFSCLGAEKSLVVGENMKTLTAKLSDLAPSARIVTDYLRERPMLEHAWPSESKRQSQHVSLRRKDVANISTTNNTLQFTKYSRLQWRLYEKKV